MEQLAMGVKLEKEKFDEPQQTMALVIWYLDFTGDVKRWPHIAETFCLHAHRPHYVGRSVAQDECLLPNSRVSRRHAKLEVVEQGVELTDLGSTNGTFVNGVRVKEPTVLCIDDRVLFERIPFRVRRSLNLPEQPFDELSDEHEQPAGFARRRLLEARRQRLASEGKLLNEDSPAHTAENIRHSKLQSRYVACKPVMIGSALAVMVASVIIYLL